MAGECTLHLFGVPELRDPEGRIIKLRTKKQLALLVYLVLEGRTRAVSRERLIDLFWSDSDPDRGRHSLAQALTAIRGALGRDVLSRGGDSVRFLGPLCTDFDPGLTDCGSIDVTRPLDRLETWAGAEFAIWVEGERARSRDRVAAGFREKIRELRRDGELPKLAPFARALYALDPLSGTAACILAEELILGDDVAAAIRLLQSHCARVTAALKCQPETQVVRLLEQLENGASNQFHVNTGSVSPEPQPTRSFVGRKTELSALERFWKEAAEGRSTTILVLGPAGIGKSALLRRFATSLLARSYPVLLISCHEMGQRIPFATASDLLNALCQDNSISGTHPLWLSEASRVHPALAARYPGIPDPAPVPTDSIRVRVSEAIENILHVYRDDGPIALLFDDVPFVDDASLDILFLLLKRLDAPFLLVGSERTTQWRNRSTADPEGSAIEWDRKIPLNPLDQESVTEIISAITGSPAAAPVAARILELSEGNPYFAELLATDWQNYVQNHPNAVSEEPSLADWCPPDTLRIAFERMNTVLEQDEEDLLSALAVAQRGLSLEEIESVSTLPTQALQSVVMRIIERAVVRFNHGQVCFKNELHRAHFYYSLSPDKKRYYHAKVAAMLQAQTHKNDYRRRLESGRHLVASGLGLEALPEIVSAADEATLRGAPREAERALEDLCHQLGNRQPQAVLTLAHARAAQGKYRHAFEAVASIAGADLTTTEQARLHLLRAECSQRGFLQNLAARRAAAEEGLARAVASEDDTLLITGIQLCAEVAAEAADMDGLERIKKLAGNTGSRRRSPLTRALALVTKGYCCLIFGERTDATQAFQESVDILQRLGSDGYLRRPLNGLGIALTSQGKVQQAVAAFHRAVRSARKNGDEYFEPMVWANLVSLHADFGQFNAAVECAHEALARALRLQHPRIVSTVSCIAASLALDLGSMEEADSIIRLGETFARKAPTTQERLDLSLVRADYLIAVDERESAWRVVEAAQARRPVHIIGEAGRQERLFRQYTYYTKGAPALQRLSAGRESVLRSLQLAPVLETRLFEKWALHKTYCRYESDAVEEVKSLKAVGVFSHLEALHCCPGLEPREVGESPAKLVSRLFPHLVDGSPPARLEWTLAAL